MGFFHHFLKFYEKVLLPSWWSFMLNIILVLLFNFHFLFELCFLNDTFSWVFNLHSSNILIRNLFLRNIKHKTILRSLDLQNLQIIKHMYIWGYRYRRRNSDGTMSVCFANLLMDSPTFLKTIISLCKHRWFAKTRSERCQNYSLAAITL